MSVVYNWIMFLNSLRNANANMQANVACNANTPSTDHNNPVYSVIADDQTAWGLSPVPPKLPPDSTPYYQEIESDQVGADYEMPVQSRSSPPHTEGKICHSNHKGMLLRNRVQAQNDHKCDFSTQTQKEI